MVAPLAPENCGCAYSNPGPSVANTPICGGALLFMSILETFLNERCAISQPCEQVVGVFDTRTEYDFIVVGGGTAGSIVAGRLSENRKNKVLLLEAGGKEPVSSRIPSFYRSFWNNPETDWMYRTVPDNYCLSEKGQGCQWPRGKTVGGSSVLNGMMYHRGHAADYEDWVNFGAEGWSWKENLPFFDMSEDNKQTGTLVDAKYHAVGGPMPVQRFRFQPEEVYDFLNAVNQSGLPVVTDMVNPKTPEGLTIAQTFSDNGQRVTTARAYLKSKKERPNLDVKVQAHVSKVLVDRSRAYGVEYIQNGQTFRVNATKEVILSAGALNSPQILMLSGIGPKDTLDKFKIPVLADLPVGKNLRNHVGMTLSFYLEKLKNVQILDWVTTTQYLLSQVGPMTATGITQMTGLLYSSLANKTREQPDLQFFFNGFFAECSKTGDIGEPVSAHPDKGTNISINAVTLLPRSKGYLTLKSTDPLDAPLFYPQYFNHPDDMVMVKDAARYVKQIVEADALKKKYGIKLDESTTAVCRRNGSKWSDEWIECMARVYTDPQNHQLGTAAISRVIDTRLRVFGIDSLRVIDASSMPTQPTGNPQGAIMMLAERGAHMIKEDWPS